MESTEILQAILLNKVKNFKWNYYLFDFSDKPKIEADLKIIKENDDFVEEVISKISKENGTYVYSGSALNPNDIFSFFVAFLDQNPNLLESVMKRIFDLNEILNNSDSDEGTLGKFNREDTERRNRMFDEKISDGFSKTKDDFIILAEGDSWFLWPKLSFLFIKKDPVKDIIDWLSENDHYAIYNLAAGGDWLSNMFYKGGYIEELPRLSPDVFLVSGGGNDLVGDGRLGNMVISPFLEEKRDLNDKYYKNITEKRKNDLNFDSDKFNLGAQFVSDEFIQFLNIAMLQYFSMFFNINKKPAYRNMLVITQGYDFAIPSKERNGAFISLQRTINSIQNTGNWLFAPLNLKGITNPDEQRAIVYFMIYEFNEMLIPLAKYFDNVFHIDCRGTAESKDDWFDELHLESHAFKKVAKKYEECIKDNARKISSATNKIYRVADH